MTAARASAPAPESADRLRPVVYLHLLGLAALAFARPLFELLAATPEFYAARGAGRADVLFTMALALLVAPAPWLLLAFLSRRALSRGGAARAAAALVGSLMALVALRAAALAAASPSVALGCAVATGVAVAWAYRRYLALRQAASVLAVAALVAVPGLFLLDPGVSRRLEPTPAPPPLHRSGAHTPVVWLVLDELSLASMLDEQDRIDARRVPHIAAFAREATWFRNAAAAASDTHVAMSAMTSGRVARAGDPRQRSHNLFTLLGDYPVYTNEAFLSLCPPDHNRLSEGRPLPQPARLRRLAADLPVVWAALTAPPGWRGYLPPLAGRWEGFAQPATAVAQPGKPGFLGRRRNLQRFLASIAPAPRAFYLGHLLFPHGPWEHLPDGRLYPCGKECFLADTWTDPWRGAQLYQRYLLQLGYTDRLVGDVLARLRRAGLYDRALVVVVADHGIALRPAADPRLVTAETAGDVLAVPLLIKRPGQREGAVVDALVSTADLPATVIDVLGVVPPWPLPGRSLFAGGRAQPTYVTGQRQPAAVPADLASRRAAAQRWLASLTAGSGGDPWRIGPRPDLLGTTPRVAAEGGNIELALDDADRYRAVDLAAATLPVLVRGRLVGSRGDGCCTLAVAVNGVVRATTRSYWDQTGTHRMAALVPPRALRPGANDVEVYASEAGGAVLSRLRQRSR